MGGGVLWLPEKAQVLGFQGLGMIVDFAAKIS
jgi:hypothetical protein